MPVIFTADAMQQAQEEPELRIGNLRYVGRILSAPEWLVFWERYADIGEAFAKLRATPDAVTERTIVTLEKQALALHLDYLRAVFPTSRFRFWAPDPVKVLARGHPRDIKGAFDAFFSLQARAMHPPDPRRPETNGTSSPPSITSAPLAAPLSA